MSRTTSTATTAASKGNMAAATSMARQKSSVDEGVKKGLLEILLEVYMNDGRVSDLVLCLITYSTGFFSF